jgi:DNA repair protein RecO
MEQFVGLIISVNKYKDSNAIINILTENGIVSVLGRGIFRDDSKNHLFTNKFIYANFDVYKGKVGGYKLRTAKIIKFYTSAISSLDYLVALDYLSEAIIKTIDNVISEEDLGVRSNLLSYVTKTLDYMVESRRIYASLARFASLLVKELGIKPNLTNVINKASQNYSFADGSIVDLDRNELNKGVILSNDDINNINKFLNCDNVDNIVINENDSKNVFVFLNRQIEVSFSIKLNSLDLMI